jgi:tetratricopeptide (TPR) repeat protein
MESKPLPTEGNELAKGTLVGRDRELRELKAGLEAAISGRGRLCLLAGEPGIGKTRLATEIATEASLREAEVLWGRCWEGGGAPPYFPWIQIIRGHAQASERSEFSRQMGDGAPLIAEIAREVRQLFPDLPAAEHPSDSEEARFRLFDATSAFLRNASIVRPLVIILDDLHWADEPSLILLQFLARELQDSRILLVCAYREVEASLAPRVASRIGALTSDARVVPLRGLTSRDVGILIEKSAGTVVGEATVDAVHRATAGNPHFVTELVRLLAAEGKLEHPEGLTSLPIPDRVREVIRKRTRLVSEECRRILSVAAVIGRDFGLSPLQEVCHVAAEEVLALLGEALTIGLIIETKGSLGRFSFSHDLVRETLYDDLSYGRRFEFHRLVAQTLERLHLEDLDAHLAELAHHFFRAARIGAAEQAAEYSARAGDNAARQLAYEEAAIHYERALEALDLACSTDGRRRCRLWLSLGDARWWAGRLQDSRAAFRYAAESAERVGDAKDLAVAAMGFAGRGAHGTGVCDERVIRLLEKALNALGEEESALRAMVMAQLAVALAFSKERERCAALAQSAVEMARRVDDKATLHVVLSKCSRATWSPDNLDERLRTSAEIVRLRDELGEAAVVGSGSRVYHLLESGDLAAAELEDEVRSPHVMRCRFCALWVVSQEARTALLKGRFEEVEGLAHRVLAMIKERQYENNEQYPIAQLFMLRREEARLGELVKEIESLAQRFPALPAWRAILGWTYAELSRETEARRELDLLATHDFLDIPRDAYWLGCMIALSELVTLLGDARAAGQIYSLLLPFSERYLMEFSVCFGSVARSLGRLASTLSRYDDALEHFERALKANERLGSPPWVAHTEYDYARMLFQRAASGDRSRALTLLGKAEKTARELAMKALAEKVEKLRQAVQSSSALAVEPNRGIAAAPSSSLFRREGEFWSISYGGTIVRMKDAKGLRYIATLLADPGREFYAGDLIGSMTKAPGNLVEGDLGPILDSAGRASFKKHLEELRDELEEAEANNDSGRAEKARAEIEAVGQALSSAIGLGGRYRRAASSSERARLIVTKAIKASLARIEREHPELGRLLADTIRTGTFCCYRPDPRAPVTWNF